MKVPAMTAKDRRAIALGLAILVPSLGWIYAVRPLMAAIAEAEERLASEQQALARERAAVLDAARNPARQHVADSAMKASANRVFTGANDVAAGASLASYLGEVAKKSRVWLANASTRNATGSGRGATPATPDAIRPLRVELRAESDFEGILAFLDALERGEKVVTVDRFEVSRTLRAGDDDRETLTINATVTGYAWSRAAPLDSAAKGGKAK